MENRRKWGMEKKGRWGGRRLRREVCESEKSKKNRATNDDSEACRPYGKV